VFGESAVMRILAGSSVLIGFDSLGFSKPLLKAFERTLRSPNGMIVVSGPAGSGRTTTVYSALSSISGPQKKIVTIEDPVEYFIPDTMQVHVNRKAGLTMVAGLRWFMRCDPDVIVAGDLRDLETAEQCINAAMTGHLVLTAMLPLDAPSVVTRLIDMGLEPFLVSSSLIAVLSQRLVRRVCPSCAAEYEPSPDLLRRLHSETSLDLARAKFRRGEGCAECRQTGYRGRIALFELLEVDDGMRELIARPAGTSELRAAAVEGGMVTMLRDGVEKAMRGITTVEEVLRVLIGQRGEPAEGGAK
jgi:type II secretory ATPase GspE/PulE/Tfp pilus assembly ATPase PilB-like protein